MKSRIVVMGLIFSGLLTIGQSFGAASTDSSQTVSSDGVTVKVTYLARTEHETRFSVVMDTHSGNLDVYDLKANSILRDNTGLAMQPTGMENKGSGHHRQTILTFPRPSTRAKWVELVINNLAGEKERVFRWDVK
ncbi:MAG TPA: hypothetical protein VFY96_18035 [Candidatus Binatia bacterium]|nr:hypothetical protein [Candidatus Binatia bacterium]